MSRYPFHAVGHSHRHAVVAAEIVKTRRGLRVVKGSFAALMLTAVVQVAVVFHTGSVALLADTIHNFGDAATALPLWLAFALAGRKPTDRFPYGYGRVEDLAGVSIVLVIFFSAIVAGYESLHRFAYPRPVSHLWAVAVASLIGFFGNEAVARFRIRVGRDIGSAALVADGHHARVDGLTSLAVLVGSAGVWLGYPLADPIVGLLITAAILRIVWESGKPVFTRLLDGADPERVDEIRHALHGFDDIRGLGEIRARWLGHRLHAELSLAVDPELSIAQGHAIAEAVRQHLLQQVRYLSSVTVHIDPADASGEKPARCTGENRSGRTEP